MAGDEYANERMLTDVVEAGEHRRLRLVEGESLSLIEESSGPVTRLTYDTDMFGHKMLFDLPDGAKALGVDEQGVVSALAGRFSGGAEAPTLSDIMDLFDRAEAPYSYMSWSGSGDAVFRAAQG